MRTFSLQTLGCKVNQYESEQIATLLRRYGLREAPAELADLRVVNTCSVTNAAAGKSRQAIRRGAAPLPVLGQTTDHPIGKFGRSPAKVVVIGCWATSDKAQAARLPGVIAVLGHHDDVAAELPRLLEQWILQADACSNPEYDHESPDAPGDEGWINACDAAGQSTSPNKPVFGSGVKKNPPGLPLLEGRHTGHQRAFLKIQDGCDAHCTYCIIPRLRSTLRSKSIDDAVEEARRLVACGHVEIVLTGIFMGAYGQPTALRRRQPHGPPPLAGLIEALCTRVHGLRRVRLSSLEPGDLTPELIEVLHAHRQVMPHFHLPLQSGSDLLLRRMNRQYTRDDFRRMIERANLAFDRPAITTDIIVGFPGETDAEFERTVEIVNEAKFIHIHAFSFSPRPGTAAARWKDDFVPGPVINQRINRLGDLAQEHSYAFRRQFIGQTAEVLVEHPRTERLLLRHGRCERYFEVAFFHPSVEAGSAVSVIIDAVTDEYAFGRKLDTMTKYDKGNSGAVSS